MVNQHDISTFKDSDDNLLLPTQMYDNINDFMKKFEEKEERKKIRRKQVKEGLQNFYEEKSDEKVQE